MKMKTQQSKTCGTQEKQFSEGFIVIQAYLREEEKSQTT